jgi:hypothetical protein
MKLLLRIGAGLLILPGLIFALQGANVLPGSVMTGQSEWLIIGSIMVLLGIGLAVLSGRSAKEG